MRRIWTVAFFVLQKKKEKENYISHWTAWTQLWLQGKDITSSKITWLSLRGGVLYMHFAGNDGVMFAVTFALVAQSLREDKARTGIAWKLWPECLLFQWIVKSSHHKGHCCQSSAAWWYLYYGVTFKLPICQNNWPHTGLVILSFSFSYQSWSIFSVLKMMWLVQVGGNITKVFVLIRVSPWWPSRCPPHAGETGRLSWQRSGRHPSRGGPASWAPQGAVHVFSCRQGAENKTKALISGSICKPVFTYVGD